ncbi:MAG: cupin domain-containing protein [Betaproteobacteria bacterium]
MPVHHNMLGQTPSATERILFPIADQALGTQASLLYENVLNPGADVPLHQHPFEEVIVCIAGVAECSLNSGPWQRYEPGSVLIIPPNTPHSLRNIGPGLLRQLAFMPTSDNQTIWLDPKGSVE